MKHYHADLVCKLKEVFPESLNVSKVIDRYDYKNGPWGQERVFVGTETVTLADMILSTAQAMTHDGTDIERGLKYLDVFKRPRVRRQEMKNFIAV